MKRLLLLVAINAVTIGMVSAEDAVDRIAVKLGTIDNKANQQYNIVTPRADLKLFEVGPSQAFLPGQAVQVRDANGNTVATLDFRYNDFDGATIRLIDPSGILLGNKATFVEQQGGTKPIKRSGTYTVNITLEEPLSKSTLTVTRK